jgi:response regulator RpfG family c-di-GMP phosphodiesterase
MSELEAQLPIEHVLVLAEGAIGPQLQVFLAEEGFTVDAVDTREKADAKLEDDQYEVLIFDLSVLPGEGVEFVQRLLEDDPDLAVVVLADFADATSAAICLQHGAYEYVTEPVDLHQLRLAIDRAIRRRGSQIQTQKISAWLKQELIERTKELERERKKLEEVNLATLGALINALEAKDPDFVGHSLRVAEMCASIASEMDLSDDEVESVRAAGRLHDIGKIGVRDDVLKKKGPLTDDERQHVQDQVVIGFRILAPLTHLGSVRQFVRSHHEHWDGSGYPDGLKGEDIPIGARIVFAAEIFDAITSPRPYQARLGPAEGGEQLRKLAGTKLDPAVVEALAQVVDRQKSLVFVDGRGGQVHRMSSTDQQPPAQV